jgi:glycosyltransferase involved in cell wall biosynthesis
VSIVALTPFIAEEFALLEVPADHLTWRETRSTSRRSPTSPPERMRRERLGLSRDARWVGYVGLFHRFHEERGLRELVTAFASVARSHPDSRLV